MISLNNDIIKNQKSVEEFISVFGSTIKKYYVVSDKGYEKIFSILKGENIKKDNLIQFNYNGINLCTPIYKIDNYEIIIDSKRALISNNPKINKKIVSYNNWVSQVRNFPQSRGVKSSGIIDQEVLTNTFGANPKAFKIADLQHYLNIIFYSIFEANDFIFNEVNKVEDYSDWIGVVRTAINELNIIAIHNDIHIANRLYAGEVIRKIELFEEDLEKYKEFFNHYKNLLIERAGFLLEESIYYKEIILPFLDSIINYGENIPKYVSMSRGDKLRIATKILGWDKGFNKGEEITEYYHIEEVLNDNDITYNEATNILMDMEKAYSPENYSNLIKPIIEFLSAKETLNRHNKLNGSDADTLSIRAKKEKFKVIKKERNGRRERSYDGGDTWVSSGGYNKNEAEIEAKELKRKLERGEVYTVSGGFTDSFLKEFENTFKECCDSNNIDALKNLYKLAIKGGKENDPYFNKTYFIENLITKSREIIDKEPLSISSGKYATLGGQFIDFLTNSIKDDSRYTIRIKHEDFEKLPGFNFFKSDSESIGVALNIKEDGINYKIYSPYLAWILTSEDVKVLNWENNKEELFDGEKFLDDFINGYKKGREYFRKNFQVSKDVLYGKNGEEMIRELHRQYYHVGYNEDFKDGWESIKNKYPRVIHSEQIENFGYFSALVDEVEELRRSHRVIFSKYKFDECRNKNKTDIDKVSTPLREMLDKKEEQEEVVKDRKRLLAAQKEGAERARRAAEKGVVRDDESIVFEDEKVVECERDLNNSITNLINIEKEIEIIKYGYSEKNITIEQVKGVFEETISQKEIDYKEGLGFKQVDGMDLSGCYTESNYKLIKDNLISILKIKDKTGLQYLSDEEIERLNQYILIIPDELGNKFQLNTNKVLTAKMFQHAIQDKLVNALKSSKKDKKVICEWLKAVFTNYENKALKNISSLLRIDPNSNINTYLNNS